MVLSYGRNCGIDDGQAVSLRGQGNSGINGGPSGDLIISVSIRRHPRFQREGTSIYLDQPVSFVQATLGGELEIDTVDGKVKWDLPAGTQPDTTFRLRGKGVPVLNGRGRGDQFVTVKVQVPTSLNREQREALEKFNEAMGGSVPGDDSPIKNFFENREKKKKKK